MQPKFDSCCVRAYTQAVPVWYLINTYTHTVYTTVEVCINMYVYNNICEYVGP